MVACNEMNLKKMITVITKQSLYVDLHEEKQVEERKSPNSRNVGKLEVYLSLKKKM